MKTLVWTAMETAHNGPVLESGRTPHTRSISGRRDDETDRPAYPRQALEVLSVRSPRGVAAHRAGEAPGARRRRPGGALSCRGLLAHPRSTPARVPLQRCGR